MVDSSTLSVARMSLATSPMEYRKVLTCLVSSKLVLFLRSLGAILASFQACHQRDWGLGVGSDKMLLHLHLQTQKGSNGRLFILTRTHSISANSVSGKSPLSSHKTTQQINGQKRWKMKEKDLSCFCLVFYSFFVLFLKAVKTKPKQSKSFSFIFCHFGLETEFICCLSMLFCGLIKRISLKICILCVCVKIKHSFEPSCSVCWCVVGTESQTRVVLPALFSLQVPFPAIASCSPLGRLLQ